MRIAMWSGPRNLSTAMMYSFGARADCWAMDEPFYAAYLAAMGMDHPMRAAIVAAGETDPARVAASLSAPPPDGKSLVYQKHMTHHMLPGFPRTFFDDVSHVFLIRHPARVLASYAKKWEAVTLADIGFPQQAQVYGRLGGLVIDSFDIRADPRRALGALCDAIGLAFDPAMLRWPAGGRPEDGIWAAHWYGAVHRSTGFAGPEGPLPELEGADRALAEKAMPHYQEMRAHALKF